MPVACVTPATLPTGIQVNIDKTAPNTPVGSFTTLTLTEAVRINILLPISGQHQQIPAVPAWPSSIYGGYCNRSWLYFNNRCYQCRKSSIDYRPILSWQHGFIWTGASKDSLNNTAGWSGTNVLLPYHFLLLIPTIHIQGNYIEDTGVCSNMTIDPNNLSLALSIAPATGTTSVCTKGVSSYGCDITIDNQSGVCTVAGHDVTLVASYAGYDAVEWRVGNVCAGAANPSISINASSPPASPIDANVYFDYGTTQSWFKTSGTSFTSKTARNNIIPNAPTAFDTDDSVAPPNNTYLTINEGGAVLYTDIGKKIELGPNAVNGFSAHNWYSNTYNATPIFTPIKFTDYMKSRKNIIPSPMWRIFPRMAFIT